MSNLKLFLTSEKFEHMYKSFLVQADKNALTGKANGPRTPYGISFGDGNNEIDGGALSQHFGQGGASKTPYISWYVVSVYYIVESSRVVIGIEEDRYKHLDLMKPLYYEQVGNKGGKVAIFYETAKDKINYAELYDRFMDVCEKVIATGL